MKLYHATIIHFQQIYEESGCDTKIVINYYTV